MLIATLSYFPLVYIPAAATLSRLDPALEESAASLGLGAWRAFFRVVLPQLRLAMTGGALLVGLHLLAEYGAFAMIRFDTFTTAIMVQYQSTFNGTAGNMLASVLVFLCLILLARGGPQPRHRPLRPRRLRRPGQRRCACRCAPTSSPPSSSLLALTVLAFGLPLCVRAALDRRRRPGRSGLPTSSSRPCCRRCVYGAGRRRGDHRRRVPDGVPGRAASRAGSAGRWSCPTTSPAPCPASSWAWPSSP